MGRVSAFVVGAIAQLAAVQGVAARLDARAAPTVDLGYEVYEGSYDAAARVNSFKGIRYAAPPLGNLRFAAPQAPATNRSSIIPATNYPPICPQSGASSETPPAYGFVSGPGDEDCLFLNVFAPENAKNLPVFFWIHGGGYGLFSSSGLDATPFINTNDNTFIAVTINYRLGAFGFLSGDDVYQDGALNAGLIDMNFALQWVQKHISKFGGDPTRVTIAGESAGGGAVMYQAMAYGGKQSQTLFQNIIAASPWIPSQYMYNDAIPNRLYDDFSEAVGCSEARDTIACLRAADTTVLQKASAKISEAGPFGTLAWLPVTGPDGTFVQRRPTEQLAAKALKGKRILSTNLANEGVPLSPPTFKTLSQFRKYITTTFPRFSAADKAALEKVYSYDGSDRDTNPSDPLFATSGTSGPTAVNQSIHATGQQQRLFNVFAEYAFDCPSYWLASAFPTAWKYQFSLDPAYHGYDLNALWSKGQTTPGRDFTYAFQKIWGSFVVNNSPVITTIDAKGGPNGVGKNNATVPVGLFGRINWPQWTPSNPAMLSLNSTGGVAVWNPATADLKYNVYTDPGMTNNFKLADARSWEGGRGARCDWWKSMAVKVPY